MNDVIKNMINCISDEDYNGAREMLKITLADYISGKQYLSNKEIFGSDYDNPNEEEQSLKNEIEG